MVFLSNVASATSTMDLFRDPAPAAADDESLALLNGCCSTIPIL